MQIKSHEQKKEFINFLNAYNECFYRKDIEGLKSFPDPAVRCTLYLECLKDKWKIIHAHYSFQPNK